MNLEFEENHTNFPNSKNFTSMARTKMTDKKSKGNSKNRSTKNNKAKPQLALKTAEKRKPGTYHTCITHLPRF